MLILQLICAKDGRSTHQVSACGWKFFARKGETKHRSTMSIYMKTNHPKIYGHRSKYGCVRDRPIRLRLTMWDQMVPNAPIKKMVPNASIYRSVPIKYVYLSILLSIYKGKPQNNSIIMKSEWNALFLRTKCPDQITRVTTNLKTLEWPDESLFYWKWCLIRILPN